ncbi:hypothetical protein JHK82_015934 [Glycine max]|nr:hypothetical protein JHK82_015934 [Glycine max]
MTDSDAFRQLQARITEMERRHEEELRKLKANHNKLKASWKPLNLEHYDETTDLDEHLDVFLTQANLYTNDDAILCRGFPTFLKVATLALCEGLPSRSIDSFDTLVECCSSQYAISRSRRLTSTALGSLH